MLLFQILDGTGNICDFRDRYVFRGSGACLHRRAGYAHRSSFRDDHAIHTRTIRAANQCTEIVRILNAIEHDNKRVFAALLLDHVIEVEIFFFRRNRDHTLVHVRCV